ncbi:STAS/SEC14 domain-containing protein [Mycolicibacterium litorale]|nr:STAS/SEC14 domain-containing protein [Mycolicibacterium litorale]
MIESLADMPAGVTGFRVSGRLSGDELHKFKPTLDKLLESGADIRIVEVIDSDYEGFGPGGLLEDLKVGFGTVYPHHAAFKRIAIVTDKEWVSHTLHALSWLVPGEAAVFGLDDLEGAKAWAAG